MDVVDKTLEKQHRQNGESFSVIFWGFFAFFGDFYGFYITKRRNKGKG